MRAQEHIAPYVFGYQTQYWFGFDDNMPNQPDAGLLKRYDNEIYSRVLPSGIHASVRANGIILFSLEECKPSRIVIYKEVQTRDGGWKDSDVVNKERRDRFNWTLGLQLVTVHATCLDNTRWLLEGSSSTVNRPDRRNEMLSGYSLEQPFFLEGSRKQTRPVNIDSISHSFDLLKLALEEQDLLDVLYVYSRARRSFVREEFEDSMLLDWLVSESCLNRIWENNAVEINRIMVSR